jgi:hypothetical protein
MKGLTNENGGRQREENRRGNSTFEVGGLEGALLRGADLLFYRVVLKGPDRPGTVDGSEREQRKQHESDGKVALAKPSPKERVLDRTCHSFIGRDNGGYVNWETG